MTTLLLEILEVLGLRVLGVQLEPAEDFASDPGYLFADVEAARTPVLFQLCERFFLLREVFCHAGCRLPGWPYEYSQAPPVPRQASNPATTFQNGSPLEIPHTLGRFFL